MKQFSKYLKPPQIQLAAPRPGDARIGDLLGTKVLATPVFSLLGFPCDEGVRRNAGRPGAALAPDKIREALFKLTPDAEQPQAFTKLISSANDLGNLAVSGNLEDDQKLLGEIVAALLSSGTIPIILGGGHETSFGHFLGYVQAGKRVHIINIDSHPDVRELIDGKGHSGSPFRQALEHPSKACVAYAVYGLAPHSCAAAHREYLENNHCEYIWRDGLSGQEFSRVFSALKETTLFSLDLDALDQIYAPGVSAPAALGMSLELWLHACELGGASPMIRSLDLVELNPNFDSDGRSARVAALGIWHFLKGLVQRLSGQGKPKLGF